MKVSEIKNYLNKKSKQEIVNLVLKLYRSGPLNKEILHTEIRPENENIVKEKFKRIIRTEFFPEKGDPKLRYSILRRAITDFKKICKNRENIADLMIYYVENGVDFTNEYGDVDEEFYIKMENMFSEALQYIFANQLEDVFHKRCLQIKINSDDIGWGFSNAIKDLYYAYYEVGANWHE
jgi:hypothetical protein